MRRPLAFFLFFACVLTGCRGKTTLSTAAGSPGYRPAPAPPPPAPFDYYVLNMSWTPAYCAKHPQAVQCQTKRGFTLHGLWPERTDGSMPLNCSTQPGPQKPGEFTDLYPDADELQHEWLRHGTCTGMAADAYLTFVRKAVAKISFPPIITSVTSEQSLQTQRVEDRLYDVNPRFVPGSLVLTCRDNHVQAVKACLTKELTPIRCDAPIAHNKCSEKTVLVSPKVGSD